MQNTIFTPHRGALSAAVRSVVLSYNLPSALVKRGFLQSARIFVQGYNLLTFT